MISLTPPMAPLSLPLSFGVLQVELDFGKWFGVYDGHNGAEMSECVAAVVPSPQSPHPRTFHTWGGQVGRGRRRATARH